jgi:parvulin-like peptidyl-prolyl isomerase
MVFIATALLLLALSSAALAADAKSFPDVPASHWAYTYVARLAGAGAISGMPDGTFAPGRSITRAEFVKLVVGALLDLPQAPPAGQHWAANIMVEAESNKLLEAGEFARDTWDKPINRQEMAKIIALAAQFVKKEAPLADTAAFTAKITDFGSIGENYRAHVAQAYAQGIVGGYADGSFGGGKPATRAEAATMVARLLDPAYRLGAAQPGQNDVIGTVNGANIYRYEYDHYFNTFFHEYLNNYYDTLLEYQGVDLLDEKSARDFLGDMENWAWQSAVQAALIRQMAAEEYNISLPPSYYESLLFPGTALSINTNRLYGLILPFMEEEVKAAGTIGEAEAKERYLADPTVWDCRKVAHIIITPEQMMDEAAEKGQTLTEEAADKAAEKLAKDIIAKLAKGEDFAGLAKQYSADGSAQAGGELDLYFNIYGEDARSSGGGFIPEFAEGAFLLKNIGDTSKEPVQSQFGYHIIKLLDKKEGFAEVKDYILDSMQSVDENAVGTYFSEKMQGLEAAAKIERKFEFKYYKED